MTNKESLKSKIEFNPHDNPDSYFAELTSWEIADNTLMFARSAELSPEDKAKGLRRTVQASFEYEGEHIGMIFEAVGKNPDRIIIQGGSLAEGHENPTMFNYVITKGAVVNGSEAEVSKDEQSRVKSLLARANLQIAIRNPFHDSSKTSQSA